MPKPVKVHLGCGLAAEEGKQGTTKTEENAKLYLVALICFLGNVGTGVVFGYSAILLPQLEEERDMDDSEASLIASVSNLGQLSGSLLAGYLASVYGRKPILLLLYGVSAGSFLVATFSKGLTSVLIVSRILQGFGIITTVNQVYITEVSTLSLRGILGATGTIGVSAGITLVYVLGSFLDWVWVSLASALLPLLCFFGFLFFCPESPGWLASHGKEDEARTVLAWLRGTGSREEQVVTPTNKGLGEDPEGERKTARALWNELTKVEVWKPCLILCSLMVLMMGSGGNVVVFYGVNIMRSLNVSRNPHWPAILLSILRLLGSVVGTVLLRYTGRKKVLIGSCLLMAGSISIMAFNNMFSFAIQTWFSEHKLIGLLVVTESWIPVISLSLYMIAFGIGTGTVPWILLGELVPPKASGITSGVATFVAYLSLFAMIQSYSSLVQVLTLPVTYLLYGSISILMAVIAGIFLPETKNRTRGEIADYFKGNANKTWTTRL